MTALMGEHRGVGIVPRAGLVALAAVLASTGLVGVLGTAGRAGAAQWSSGSGSGQYAALKRALLVRSDFPSGWSGGGPVTTSRGGGGGFPGQSQLAGCLGVSQSLLSLNSPTATSPNFQDKGGTHYVQDNANAFPSTKIANEEYAAISSPKVAGCLTTDLQLPATKQQLEKSMSGTVGTVTVTAASPAVLVRHTSGFVIAFPATVQGINANVTITVVSTVRGKTGQQISFTSVGTPIPTSLQHHLVAIAYGRT
jgi:hypothetical protein